jgi:hypothetical protein
MISITNTQNMVITDTTEIFQSHIVRDLKKISDSAIARKRAEKGCRDTRSQRKTNISWVDENNTTISDTIDEIRPKHVTL